MKKGDRLQIGGLKKGSVRTNGWTEIKTSEKTIKKGTHLFHVSYDRIESFASVETCFTEGGELAFDSSVKIYIAVPKMDLHVPVYEDEIRFVPTSENCDIYYAGTTSPTKLVRKDKFGHITGRLEKARLSKLFREDEKKINQYLEEKFYPSEYERKVYGSYIEKEESK